MPRPLSQFEIDGKSYLIVSAKESVNISTEDLLQLLGAPPISEIQIGYLVRHHRVAKGITQRDLAAAVEVDQKHIDKIENCKIRNPSASLLGLLIRELGPDFGRALQFFGLPRIKTQR